MQNAVLITGGPATGRNSLAFAIANSLSPDRHSWLFCPSAHQLEPRPGTRVVIAEGITSIGTIGQFLPQVRRWPFFFILLPQRTRLNLPPAWDGPIARFALSSFCEGSFLPDHGHAMPEAVTAAIAAEMAWRRDRARQQRAGEGRGCLGP
jgi:hypothetical protein